jgi:hypothetical protein
MVRARRSNSGRGFDDIFRLKAQPCAPELRFEINSPIWRCQDIGGLLVYTDSNR